MFFSQVVDYVLISEDLMSLILDFEVGTITEFSDHCPLHIYMKYGEKSMAALSNLIKIIEETEDDWAALAQQDQHTSPIPPCTRHL